MCVCVCVCVCCACAAVVMCRCALMNPANAVSSCSFAGEDAVEAVSGTMNVKKRDGKLKGQSISPASCQWLMPGEYWFELTPGWASMSFTIKEEDEVNVVQLELEKQSTYDAEESLDDSAPLEVMTCQARGGEEGVFVLLTRACAYVC